LPNGHRNGLDRPFVGNGNEMSMQNMRLLIYNHSGMRNPFFFLDHISTQVQVAHDSGNIEKPVKPAAHLLRIKPHTFRKQAKEKFGL